MCYCANVSFTASAGLAAIGTATLIWRSRPEERFITSIPLWFAVQQAVEGALWLQLERPTPDEASVQMLTTAYLFFALFWWPVYTCFAAFWMEPVPQRRRILSVMTGIGLVIGVYLYLNHLQNPQPAAIVDASISHQLAGPGVLLFTGLYIVVSLAVGLASSQPRLKLFYALFALSTVVAMLWYRQTFTSMWCFFAAILSALLWFNPGNRKPVNSTLSDPA